MSDTQLTFKSTVPPAIGIVTYTITDSMQKPEKVTVNGGQSVDHPTNPTLTPWKVYSEINSSGATQASAAVGTQTITTPTATINTELVMTIDPPPAENPDSSVSGQNFYLPAVFDYARWLDVYGSTQLEGNGQTKQLPFAIQAQQQSKWCWAAVASSISAYLLRPNPPKTEYDKCALANHAFSRTDCCQTPTPTACNNSWSTFSALTYTGNLRTRSSGRMLIGDIETEIDNNHPIAVRIAWFTGKAHAVVIDGYDVSGSAPYINIKDPWGAAAITTKLADFPAGYRTGGAWTDSYLTKTA